MADILSQLDPQYASDQIDLQRRMALAQALREQSMSSMGNTEVINGVAIRRSPMEGLAKIGEALASSHLDAQNRAERLQSGQRHFQLLQDMLNGNQQQQPQTSLPVDPTQAMQSGSPMTGSLTNQAIQNMPQSQGSNLPPQQPQNNFNFKNALQNALLGSISPEMAKSQASLYIPTNEDRNLRSGVTQALAGIDVNKAISLQRGLMPGEIYKAGAVKGAELPFLPPTQVTTPAGTRLMTPAQQIQYATGGKNVNPQGGQGGAILSPEEAKVNDAKGTAAIQAATIQEKAKPLLAAIDEALAINDKVPYGSLGLAKAQVTASNLPYFGSGEAAKYATKWDQLTGTSILNGISEMQNAGASRMSGQLIDTIKEQRGIPMENHPIARKAYLEDLKRLVLNNTAAAQNVVPALNQPGIVTNTKQSAMQLAPEEQNGMPTMNAIQAEIARRRGK